MKFFRILTILGLGLAILGSSWGLTASVKASEANNKLRMHLSSFLMGSVHSNRFQNKILKWKVPLNVLILPRKSEHAEFIRALIVEVRNSINHEITLVGPDTKVNVNVLMVTAPDIQRELEKGEELFKEFFYNERRFKDVVENLGDQACYSTTIPDPDLNFITGLVIASTIRPTSIVQKCLSIGIFQVLGFSYKEDSDLPSVLTNVKIFRPTSLDLKALGFLYQSKFKSGNPLNMILNELD